MSDRPFEDSLYPHFASESSEASDSQDSVEEHLAEDTVGEDAQDTEDLDGADLADELHGRPTPPFRTPHPGHESS